MNVEKITAVMDKFESQFESLDLTTGVMENSMVSSTAQSMPESQVENLMQQVADEHGLEFAGGLNSLPNGMNKLGQKVEAGAQKQQEKPNVLLAAGAQPAGKDGKDNKGDDNKPAGGDGGAGGGGAAVSSGIGGGGGGASADDDESSLEDRLRRLQQ